MNYQVDLKDAEQADRLTIIIGCRQYFIYEQNGKLHIVVDSKDRMQIEPCSNNSIDLI
ncbi:hypothetical protein CLV62_10491 [Dysgonomonas alginatilytica]|uniref:Uncharacterized protein n=1 Tax=Dysgonomonas alginatilytica TaxID=1605892 RepID=A0A2V3PR69_9BACT|nr:hypothetical protein [Dysgonomonas alginatilytica]PXV66830.1 hypothetical protein CLV62_10491 [Dysgonomonas alginatilytica]